jgi:DNA polymerase (family 10)
MSSNAQVAELFTQIADYLEVAGENSFKIRAYRRAAEAVATYPGAIEEAAAAGTLREIEGLGEATAAKTQEYLQTGQMQYLERLKEKYPPGLMELLRVPGLGP